MGGIFKGILSSDETLFKNEIALDFSFQPKLIPYRENEQRFIANCMKPLFLQKNGNNVFVYGQPGIGKTAACRHILKEIEEETEEVVPIYINCWQKNTTHKIILDICEVLDYKFVQNRRTEELFTVIKQLLNRKAAVFVFDEVDKLEDANLLYMVLEEIYRKSIVLVTNYKEWLDSLDDRIKSRLMAEKLEFRTYNREETKGILKQRMDYAFFPGVWENDAFELVVKKAAETKDIRTGLHLMRKSANEAENKSSRKVTAEHVNAALQGMEDFSIKDKDSLNKEEQLILNVVKENPDCRIGDVFTAYQQNGGNLAYRTFQRKVDKLEKSKFIVLEKTGGGEEGNTTVVKYNDAVKKLTEF